MLQSSTIMLPLNDINKKLISDLIIIICVHSSSDTVSWEYVGICAVYWTKPSLECFGIRNELLIKAVKMDL